MAGSERSIDQSHTEASKSSDGLPWVGTWGRIQSSRFSAVSVEPSGIVRPSSSLESTGRGGAARSGIGSRSGWRVLNTRQKLHMPAT